MGRLVRVLHSLSRHKAKKEEIVQPLFFWYNVHESEKQCGKGRMKSSVVLAHKQLFIRPFP